MGRVGGGGGAQIAFTRARAAADADRKLRLATWRRPQAAYRGPHLAAAAVKDFGGPTTVSRAPGAEFRKPWAAQPN